MEHDRSMSRATLVCLIVFVILLMAGLIAGILVGINRDDIGLKRNRYGSPEIYLGPDKAVPEPGDYAWTGKAGNYRYAGVASENTQCNRIGNDIMAYQSGGAVDAAIAVMFCLGVVNPMMSGIGGGHFMTVYDKTKDEGQVFIAREVAPQAAREDMFTVTGAPSSTMGPVAIGVPGEVAGLWEEHKMYGRAEWSSLVDPAIELARNGFTVTPLLADLIQANKGAIYENEGLRGILFSDGEPLKAGDTMKNALLADTLTRIRDNPTDMYDPNSTLVKDILDDIGPKGIITAQDFGDYKVAMKSPLEMQISDEYTLLTPPPPSSGFIVGLTLQILGEYNLNSSAVETKSEAVETYQRVVETFKHTFAQRSKLGDADYVSSVEQLMTQLTDPARIKSFVEMIDKSINKTMNWTQYETQYAGFGNYTDPNDSGVSSVAVYGPDGTAVAVTSSINTYFGSMVFGRKTGIIFNNQMDDFAKKGQVDAWGLAASQYNLVEPGKRPMSSQSPSIVLNSNDEVAMVTAAAGGSTMITNLAQTIMKALYFNWTAHMAVDDPRLHHQLLPDIVQYQPGFSGAVLEGLLEKGHVIQEFKNNRAAGDLLTSVVAIKNACAVCASVNATMQEMCRESCMLESAVDGRRADASQDGY